MLAESLDVATARLHRLVGDALLAVWDGTGPRPSARIAPKCGDTPLPRPHATFLLPTAWGGMRTIVAMRWPALQRNDQLTFASEKQVVAHAAGAVEPFDAAALVNGLSAGARARLVAMLVDFCHAAFGRHDEKRFAALCRACLGEIFPDAAPLLPVVEVDGGLILCEGALPQEFGPVSRALVVERDRVRPLAFPATLLGPAKGSSPSLHLMLEAGGDDALVVLFGEAGGLACRAVRGKPPSLRLLEWLERRKPAVPVQLRDYVASCLAARAAAKPTAASVLEEMQLLAPLPRRGLFSKNRPVGAEFDLAISHQAGGLFVAGWLHDPHGMVERIESISPVGVRRVLDGPLHRFPRPDVAEQYGERALADRSGFAAFQSGTDHPVALYQHRFELHLRSGATLDVVPGLPPQGLAEARNAVLGSIPPMFATSEALEHCIAPAAANLHAAYMATKGEAEVVRFGQPPAAPSVTVVVPLYRVIEFLRFQLGAFAIDPSLAEAEFIFVLDSPEQRHEVEHLLLGLHALYGLPLTLLVMTGNYGFSAACNAGGRAARGDAVLFLNSDVVPDRPGWIRPLLAALAADAEVGAVGPKLLFDDQSLQHAGMFFARDLKGDWLNQHYFKGLPRDFGPANRPRSVPAVTGAALLIRRAAYEAVGGFAESYIIGDYEDSDLCLRLRAAGWDIGYVPAAELFHLERQSIQHHAGYMRGVACLYNRRLHSRRWSTLMEELCPKARPSAARNDDFTALAGAAE
jgi:O-antigen biosynthesis protein